MVAVNQQLLILASIIGSQQNVDERAGGSPIERARELLDAQRFIVQRANEIEHTASAQRRAASRFQFRRRACR